jgi:hypothetical protein
MAWWAAPIRGARVWRSVTDAPYAVETVTAPEPILAELRRQAALHDGGIRTALLGPLAGIGPVVAVVFGTIALIDLVFGVITPSHWIVLVVGSAILLVPALLISLREGWRAQPRRNTMAAALRAEADTGEVLRHTLLRDARHWFVEHEHGVIHVSPADAARTLYLDLSSITDDPRHDHWYKDTLIDRTRWTWFTTREGGMLLGFEADGDALPRNRLAERPGAGEEAGAALFRYLREPDDGDLVARPFAEVDAFLRARA